VALASLAWLALGHTPHPSASVPTDPVPVPAPSFLTPHQRTAIIALYERAVAAGFPDARQATLHAGLITYSTGQHVDQSMGIHLRLPDGSWVLRGLTLVRPGIPSTHIGALPAEPLVEIPLPALAASASAVVKQASILRTIPYLELLDPSNRERAQAAYTLAGDLAFCTRETVAALHWLRLDVPQAEAVFALAAITELCPRRFEDEVPLAAGPGEPHWLPDWKVRHKQKHALPDPVEAARRALCGWFADLVCDPLANHVASGLSIAQAVDGALALTPDGRREELRARFHLLMQSRRLPPPEDEPPTLATRIQTWDPNPANGKPPRWIPRQADIPALLTLLDDPRPSCWVQGNTPTWRAWDQCVTPRTLGDNALRAIACALNRDPRAEAGYDPGAIWTPDERRACTAALRTWWRKQDDQARIEPQAADQPAVRF
jgi:hypothetical protein